MSIGSYSPDMVGDHYHEIQETMYGAYATFGGEGGNASIGNSDGNGSINNRRFQATWIFQGRKGPETAPASVSVYVCLTY
jgi:hypothetical protein